MEAGGDAGGGKRKICHGRDTGYDHDDGDDDDVDEEKKMEIFCALISSTRDHILNNINIANGSSSSAELLIHSHRAAAAAAPNTKKMKTAVDVDYDPADYCNNLYRPPNIINYHHKAAAAAWQPSFQHEDFIKGADGDNKIQSASRLTCRSPRANMSMIMTTTAAAAATSPPPPPPPPLMMVKQPIGDYKLADHHHPKDALDLKLSL